MCHHLMILALVFQPCLGDLVPASCDSATHPADNPCTCMTQGVSGGACFCVKGEISESSVPPWVPDTRDAFRQVTSLLCTISLAASAIRLPDQATGNEPASHLLQPFFCIWLK